MKAVSATVAGHPLKGASLYEYYRALGNCGAYMDQMYYKLRLRNLFTGDKESW
jgi:hypothetical protein